MIAVSKFTSVCVFKHIPMFVFFISPQTGTFQSRVWNQRNNNNDDTSLKVIGPTTTARRPSQTSDTAGYWEVSFVSVTHRPLLHGSDRPALVEVDEGEGWSKTLRLQAILACLRGGDAVGKPLLKYTRENVCPTGWVESESTRKWKIIIIRPTAPPEPAAAICVL